jgi:hypothetical protein
MRFIQTSSNWPAKKEFFHRYQQFGLTPGTLPTLITCHPINDKLSHPNFQILLLLFHKTQSRVPPKIGLA